MPHLRIPFIIPAEENLSGDIIAITGFSILGKNHKPIEFSAVNLKICTLKNKNTLIFL